MIMRAFHTLIVVTLASSLVVAAAAQVPGVTDRTIAGDALAEPSVPSFIDPNLRLPRPDLSARTRLRFLTVTDFPPFSFIDARKRLTGFHVDLAREICRTLSLLDVCQIQAVPLAELEAELLGGNGEVALAGLRPSVTRREVLDFSRPYFRLPGRFAALASSTLATRAVGDGGAGSAEARPFVETLAGQEVGVVDATAHAAFAREWFGAARLRLFADRQSAIEALRAGAVAAVFDDAVQLSFLMQESGPGALAFVGPPYVSADYFGTGLSAALAVGDAALREGIDYALAAIIRDGRFEELYLRYFPLAIF